MLEKVFYSTKKSEKTEQEITWRHDEIINLDSTSYD